MKGTYINTVIIMAARSGKISRKPGAQNETIKSLNDFKIIWSKAGKSNNPVASKPKAALIN